MKPLRAKFRLKKYDLYNRGPVIPGDSNHLSVGVCSARLCLGSQCVLGMGRGIFLFFCCGKIGLERHRGNGVELLYCNPCFCHWECIPGLFSVLSLSVYLHYPSFVIYIFPINVNSSYIVRHTVYTL